MNILSGELIANKYKVIEKIGEGGMAIVFKAENIDNGENAAIKFMKENVTSSYVEDLIRFRREIEVVSRLNHINIVKVFGMGEYKNTPYVIMELLEGESLADLLQKGKVFNSEEAVEIVRQLAVALIYVHSQGIIHRDLKPGNIMIERSGDQIKAKLLDFGLALVMKLGEIEGEDEVVGTFGYMSPEATGILNKKLDERSDLYSLGVIFYHLLSGSLPFRTKELSKLLHQQVAFIPPKPSSANRDIPLVLDDIIMKLICKDPDQRYQSAKGLLYDLERFQNGWNEFIIGEKDQKIRLTYQTRLTGREVELGKLKRLYNKTLEDRGSICLIGAEAGAGKSRLVEELKGYVYEQGGLFLEGKCFNQENKIPYQPFKDAVDGYIRNIGKLDNETRELEVSRIKAVLGDLGGIVVKLNPRMDGILGDVKELTSLEPERENKRFLLVLSDFFCHLAREEKACVLVLDDLQWADEGSISLLEEILGRIDSSNLLVLGTYRDNETEEGYGLERVKRLAKEKGQALEDIKLAPLNRESLNKLIARLLGEKEEQCYRLTEYVLEKSRGVTFFAIEIIRQLVDEKAIVYEEDHWKTDWNMIGTITISATIVDIILRRIDSLRDELLNILYYGAVIGREFEVDLLKNLTGLSDDKIIALVDEAIGLQLLERSSIRGRVFFVHDRVRDAFYKRIGEEKRRGLHLEVAEKMEEIYAGNIQEVFFDITHHFIESGEKAKSLLYCLPAAEKAKEGYANEDAIRYYNVAIEIMEESRQKASAEWTKAKEGLTEVCLVTGKNDEAIQIAQEVLALKETPLERARVFRQIGTAYFKKGDFVNCEDKIAEGLALLGEVIPLTKVEVRLSIVKQLLIHVLHNLFPGLFSHKKGKTVKAEAIEIADLHLFMDWMYIFSDIEKYACSVLTARNYIESRIGKSIELGRNTSAYAGLCMAIPLFRRALKYHEKTIDIMNELRDEWGLALGIQIMSYCYLWKGEHQKSLECLQKSKEIFQRLGDLWELGIVVNCLGDNNYYIGDYRSAITFMNQYLNISEKIKDNQGVSSSLSYLSHYYTLIGEFKKAEELAKKALSISKEKQILFIECVTNMHLGHLEMEKGNFEKAIEYLETARNMFNEGTFIPDYTVQIYTYLAEAHIERLKNSNLIYRTGDFKTEVNKIGMISKQALKLTKPWVNQYGMALRARARYYDLAGKKNKAEKFFLASIRQTEALGRKFELAKGLYEYGYFLRSHNKVGQAKEQWQKAYNIFKEMGAQVYTRKCKELLGYTDVNEQVKEFTIQDRLSVERRMSTVLATSRYLSSILDLDELLEKIMDKAIELTGAERGMLLLYPEEGERSLEVRVARNLLIEEFGSKAFETSSSIISRVENDKNPLIISDAGSHEELKSQASVVMYGLRSVICAPIMVHGNILGVIYLDNRLVSGLFNIEDLNILDLIAGQAGVSIENARLYNKAIRDGLTGLLNRSFLDDYLIKNIFEARRYQRKLSVLMVDIDFFKKINDNYGHQVGDIVLKSLAEILLESVRRSDVVARYGGEEFAMVLPETGLEGAIIVAEKIRGAIERHKVSCSIEDKMEEVGVTVSLGIAEWVEGDSKLTLIEKADKALYKAKKKGRNRIIVWEG